MFFRKRALKICSKFTGEHLCSSVISMYLQYIFVEMKLLHVCFPVNLPHICRKLSHKNTCGGLFFKLQKQMQEKQPTFNIFFDFSHIFRQIVIHIKVD